MGKKALIVWGGWDGHEPEPVANIFAKALREKSFEVEVSPTLDSFKDEEKLKALDLIIPIWTMGSINGDQERPLLNAVESGVGLAGCHGGMCDAFRNNTEYQFMTGGQWVAHPGGILKYWVNIDGEKSPITDGIKDFEIESEQYYLHVDPAVKVLATTTFPTADGPHAPNGKVKMPVVWTKMWGKGRVFYNSLGHNAKDFQVKEALELCVRGFLWAAK